MCQETKTIQENNKKKSQGNRPSYRKQSVQIRRGGQKAPLRLSFRRIGYNFLYG